MGIPPSGVPMSVFKLHELGKEMQLCINRMSIKLISMCLAGLKNSIFSVFCLFFFLYIHEIPILIVQVAILGCSWTSWSLPCCCICGFYTPVNVRACAGGKLSYIIRVSPNVRMWLRYTPVNARACAGWTPSYIM